MDIIGKDTKKSKLTKKKIITLSVGVLLMLLVGALFGHRLFEDRAVKSSQYQAVFLSNGQVYFGKLSDVDEPYVKLTNVYYPLAQQNQVAGTTNGTGTSGQTQIIKLGGEMHGPEDQMNIPRSNILFWENLKDSGQVVQIIKGKKQ